jgi:ferrous iron transport protein A
MSALQSSSPPSTRPATGTIPLCDLRPGGAGVVDEVTGDPGVGQRLRDLGFIPGTPVRVIRRAPLGDPILYELRGYRIALRRSEGRQIRVRPE